MKLLIDTHLLLWAASEPERLSQAARALLLDTENALLFSAASIWEVVIKASLGRPDFSVDARTLRRGLLDNAWYELPVSGLHAAAVSHLPPIHKDPFDRMLIAQADCEGILLVTSDADLTRYPGPIRKV